MTVEKFEDKFTRYEVARILGARSLQLAMNAPVLLKLSAKEEDGLEQAASQVGAAFLLKGEGDWLGLADRLLEGT